jgi:hypothetical protein
VFPAGLVAAVVKAFEARTSLASQRYEQAQLHGTWVDRSRETLRRSLRQILGTAILACLPLGLLIEHITTKPEDEAFLLALLLSVPLALVLWAVYHFLRFVLAR